MEEGNCYCGNSGNWVIDPYAYELYGEENWDFICDGCYAIAIDEI